jgi:hypothetical protein
MPAAPAATFALFDMAAIPVAAPPAAVARPARLPCPIRAACVRMPREFAAVRAEPGTFACATSARAAASSDLDDAACRAAPSRYAAASSWPMRIRSRSAAAARALSSLIAAACSSPIDRIFFSSLATDFSVATASSVAAAASPVFAAAAARSAAAVSSARRPAFARSPPVFASASRICACVTTSFPVSCDAFAVAPARVFSAAASCSTRLPFADAALVASWPSAVTSERAARVPERSEDVSTAIAMFSSPPFNATISSSSGAAAFSLHFASTAREFRRAARGTAPADQRCPLHEQVPSFERRVIRVVVSIDFVQTPRVLRERAAACGQDSVRAVDR